MLGLVPLFVLILYPCLVELAANSAAPSGSNKPPVFAQPRSDTYDPPLSSHDPPGSNSLFSKSENFVRDLLMKHPCASYASPGSRGGPTVQTPGGIYLLAELADPSDLFRAPIVAPVNIFAQSRNNPSRNGRNNSGLPCARATQCDRSLRGNHKDDCCGRRAKYCFYEKIQQEMESICDAVHGRMEQFEPHQHPFDGVSV